MNALEGAAAGFALGCAIPFSGSGGFLAGLLLVLMGASAVAARIGLPLGRPFWSCPWGAVVVTLAIALPLGGCWTAARARGPGAADISRHAPLRVARLEGIVVTDPAFQNGSWRFQLRAERLDFPFRQPVSGWLAVSLDAHGPHFRGAAPEAGPPPHGESPSIEAAGPRYGERVWLEGTLALPDGIRNPGETDFAAYYARHGIFATCHAKRIRSEGEITPWWDPVRLAICLKARSVIVLGAGLSRQAKALMGSLLFGAGAVPVDDATRQDFTDLGLAHALAASGLQTTLLVRLIVAVAGYLAVPAVARAGVAGLAIALFAAMCGFAPSIMRATWMAGVALLAEATGRRAAARRTLTFSTLAMLVADPHLVFDMGFQFSVASTWGLLQTGAPLRAFFDRRAPGRPSAIGSAVRSILLEVLCTPIAAFLWCLPLQLTLFGQVSAWSLPANWFADGLIVALTDVGFVVAVLGLIWIPLAWPGRFVIGPMLGLLQGGLAWLHSLPGASLHVEALPAWAAVALYALLLATWGSATVPQPSRSADETARAFEPAPDASPAARPLAALRARLRRAAGHDHRLLALVASSGAILGLAYWPPPPALTIAILDVGQGDAIAIRSPRGRWAIVDAGPADYRYDSGRAIVVPELWRMGCTHLALAVLTHPHMDHLGGMGIVLSSLGADQVWDAGQPCRNPRYQRFLLDLLVSGTPFQEVQAGQTANLDGVRFDVLGPGRPFLARTRSDPGNNGVILRLTYGSFRMLLAADAEQEEEERLLATPKGLQADILKVPHHGSRFASTAAFLAAVRPKANVISVGARNFFGQPDPETIRRLLRWGPVYRTDRDGGVLIRSDGRTWTLSSTTEVAAR